MNYFIPAFMREQVLEQGEDGVQWLENLPQRIARLEKKWGLIVGRAFDHGGAVSWVAPVELGDGTEAVLKVGLPHHESRFEAEALRFLDGYGAVRVLDVSEDGYGLLLERCVPGTDLWSLDEPEGDEVAGRILKRMWREPDPGAPFALLSNVVDAWWERLSIPAAAPKYDAETVAYAIARGRELIANQPRLVVLHGDFHPGNVLAAQREPWLVIDPKPLIGEPAFDLAQWLYNRSRFYGRADDPEALLRRSTVRFASELDLDPHRIAGWAFVKSVGWQCQPAVVSLFQELAQLW